MFATIRKHQTWLFAFIIAAVIVSFVIYFTPGVGRRGRGGLGRSEFGTIHGRAISRREYFQAYLEAKLGFMLRYGTWPDGTEGRKFGFSPEREARTRLVMLDRLEELAVRADDSSVAQWILERFADPKQPNSAKANYEGFVRRELPRHGVTEGEFQKFIQHEIGIAHLGLVAGTTGKLLTPRDAASLFRHEQEKIEAQAVVFAASNFLAKVKLDAAALAQFYTNREANYRIPERVKLSYVRFELTNFLGQADELLAKRTNLTAEIDQLYLARGPNFFTDSEGHVLTADAAKAKIRQDQREEQARLLAHKEAARFATELFDVTPVKPENLNTLAAAKGRLVSDTEPFSEFEAPRTIKLTRGNLGELAFKLRPEEPFSPPLRGEDGIYLLALRGKLPSELPTLDSIRPRVTEEFRRDEARELARAAGTNFLSVVTNGLARGAAFADLCQEGQVVPISLPRFSPGSQSVPDWDRRLDLRQVKAAATGLAVGKASGLVRTGDGGFVLYVKARAPVGESELKADLPKFIEQLRQQQQYEAANEWFRKQVELSRIDTYGGKEDQAPDAE